MTKMLTSDGAMYTHTHTHSTFTHYPNRKTTACSQILNHPSGKHAHAHLSHTFMMKKSSKMRKTLTSGCSQAAERPRPTGGGEPEIFVQVKLSNRELMHSLGISWGKGSGGVKGDGQREERNEEELQGKQSSCRKVR